MDDLNGKWFRSLPSFCFVHKSITVAVGLLDPCQQGHKKRGLTSKKHMREIVDRSGCWPCKMPRATCDAARLSFTPLIFGTLDH